LGVNPNTGTLSATGQSATGLTSGGANSANSANSANKTRKPVTLILETYSSGGSAGSQINVLKGSGPQDWV
jgi:hypothetical protein